MEYKAIALNDFLTARETSGRQVLLFVPSDGTEAGHYIPANEIFVTREEIKRLYNIFVNKEAGDV